ncbi:MAG: AMIN domain-containing protein, partial [Candidatus Aminicenantaceae bacterium]
QTAARVSFDLADKMPIYEISRVATGVRVVFLVDRAVKPPPPPPVVKKEEEPRAVTEEAHLRSIRYERVGQQLQVLIDATGTFSYDSQVINNNRRLAIDFWPIQKLSARSITDIDVFGLKRIEVNRTEAETVRIALDYADSLPAFAITRIESGVKILLSAPEPADTETTREEPRRKRWEPYPPLKTTILSFTGGMYSISDELFKEIYGGSALIYGAELNQVVLSNNNHNFALMLGFRSFSKTGALTETQEETKFSLTPLTLGVRYLYNLKQIALFIGGGVDFLSYKEENVIEDVSGSTTGFHAMGGFFFKFPGLSALHIMAYAKYTSATATENDIEIALGGIEAGLGLSLGFNLF